MLKKDLLKIGTLLLLALPAQAVSVNSQSVLISPNGKDVSLSLTNYRHEDYFCEQIDLELEFVSSNFSQNLGVMGMTLIDQYIPARSTKEHLVVDSEAIQSFRSRSPGAVVNRVNKRASCRKATFRDYCEFAEKSSEEEHTIEQMMDWASEFRCEKLEKDIGSTLRLIRRNIVSLKPISYLKRLKTLSLFKNDVSDLSPLANMRYLQKLIVSHNPVKDLGPVVSLPEIRNIYANNTLVESLEGLEPGPKLNPVSLNQTPYMDKQ